MSNGCARKRPPERTQKCEVGTWCCSLAACHPPAEGTAQSERAAAALLHNSALYRAPEELRHEPASPNRERIETLHSSSSSRWETTSVHYTAIVIVSLRGAYYKWRRREIDRMDICMWISAYFKEEKNHGWSVDTLKSLFCFAFLHVDCLYIFMAMNEGFVAMGTWPTYGPACLHRINPAELTQTHKRRLPIKKFRMGLSEGWRVIACVPPGAQYILAMASLLQDSSTSFQLPK